MNVLLIFATTTGLANLAASTPVTFVNDILLHKLLNQIHCLLNLRTYWIRKILSYLIYIQKYIQNKIT